MTSTASGIDAMSSVARLTPASREELAEALHAADSRGQAVAPVGGGTQLDLGMPPSRLDVVIETTGLNKIVEYEPADLTVTVEAGSPFEAVLEVLGEQGHFVALYRQ